MIQCNVVVMKFQKRADLLRPPVAVGFRHVLSRILPLVVGFQLHVVHVRVKEPIERRAHVYLSARAGGFPVVKDEVIDIHLSGLVLLIQRPICQPLIHARLVLLKRVI